MDDIARTPDAFLCFAKEKYPKERRPDYLPLILNDKLTVQYRI